MKLKKLLCIALCTTLIGGLAACGNSGSEDKGEKEVINIAYQYGLAYAPLIIAEKNNTIEEAYKEATGDDVEINWIQMNSGADINTGIASGEIDVGFMGVGPAITGVAKDVGYKIFTNLSGQDHGMMVNDNSVGSLKDLVGSDKQIAVVNIGSIQHIILAMALENEGIDPHALDGNLIAMKHPDGMTALTTGNVFGHVTSSPYIYKEEADEKLYPIEAVSKAWTNEDSFIVGVAAEAFKDGSEAQYEALCEGIGNAMDFINNNVEEAAELTYELNGNTLEDEILYLEKGHYSTETSGVVKMAEFMYKNKFVDVDPGAYEDIVYENVKGN